MIPGDIKNYIGQLARNNPSKAKALFQRFSEAQDDEERIGDLSNKFRMQEDYRSYAAAGNFGPDVQKYQEELR